MEYAVKDPGQGAHRNAHFIQQIGFVMRALLFLTTPTRRQDRRSERLVTRLAGGGDEQSTDGQFGLGLLPRSPGVGTAREP